MNKKRTIYTAVLLILICTIFVMYNINRQLEESGNANVFVVPELEKPQEVSQPKLSDSAIIDYPSEFNFAQTYNNCAPYNAAAVVRALTGENISSEELSKTIKHRIQYNWTLPEGITEQLNDYGIITETPDLKSLTDEERIEYLKQKLINKNPVILLIKKEDFQHYITLLGFDSEKNEFYIYDSLMERLESGVTKDENNDLPGNKTLTTKKLLESWSGGGMLGKYRWHAIISSK